MDLDRRRMLHLSSAAAASTAFSALPAVVAAQQNTPASTVPSYLRGHYQPVSTETTAKDLVVRGRIPPSLAGRYLRNGHNPMPGVTPKCWFYGSGMIHGIRLKGGRAEWYRNRWVRTPALEGAPLFSRGKMDLTASAAGTHVVAHAGRILALQEVNLPFELTPDLATTGVFDFNGVLKTMMTAHPKADPLTGELIFFGNSPLPPYLTYHVASADGRLVHSEIIDGPQASVIHDFAITRNYIIWFDGNVTLDMKSGHAFPYGFDPKYQARIGVMSRDRSKPAVRWLNVNPFFTFHLANAYETTDGKIMVEGPYFDQASSEKLLNWVNHLPGHGDWVVNGSRNARWTIDLEKGEARPEIFDELSVEFPTINNAFIGKQNRYTYATAFPDKHLASHAIVKYDAVTGRRDVLAFSEGEMPSEPYFVAAPDGGGEDHGWLLSYISNVRNRSSELRIYDAAAILSPPIAVVELPSWIPAGVHGSWIDDAALDGRG